MTSNQNLIKIFEYALNQEETGKSFFQTSFCFFREYRDKLTEIYSKMPWGG